MFKRIVKRLDYVIRLLEEARARELRFERKTTMDIDTIIQKASDQKGVIDSMTVLLTNVSAELRANLNNPAKLQTLADALDANTAEAAAAIAANPDPAQTTAAAAGPTQAAAAATPAADLPASPVTA